MTVYALYRPGLARYAERASGPTACLLSRPASADSVGGNTLLASSESISVPRVLDHSRVRPSPPKKDR
jgi:hypothetical protein